MSEHPVYPHVLPKFRPLLIVHRTLFSKCRGVLHFGPPLGQTMTDLNDVIAAIERLRTDLRAGSQSENVKIVSTLNDRPERCYRSDREVANGLVDDFAERQHRVRS